MAGRKTQSLSNNMENLSTELQICRRKLESKCEALLILSRELDQCRSERDQFKLMAEQLRDRYQMVKRQLTGDTPIYPAHVEVDPKTYSDTQTQSIARLLFDTKESNKTLKFQVDDLKQKLHDAEGDIKLLREQIARSRVGTTDEGLNTRHFPAHEREALVKDLEASREEYVQLQRDLQQVLDEKEELVTERDAYRTKHERLNTELSYILGGDERRIIDIDALNMENKFLQERLKQIEEEKSMAIATVTKYKSILEKRKTRGILKLGQSRNGGLVISQKQVQDILQNKPSGNPTPQAMTDLQGLCSALLDTVNDKNLALSHQRKTNKLLGNRVNELEKKLRTLEVSGLWSVSGQVSTNLEKLRAECEDIKTLVPVQLSSPSHSGSEPPAEGSDLGSSLGNSVTSSPGHQSSVHSINNRGLPHQLSQQLNHLDLEELDLLPTKEEVVKCGHDLLCSSDSQLSASSTLDPSPGLADLGNLGQDGVKGSDIPTKLLHAGNRQQYSKSGQEWSYAFDSQCSNSMEEKEEEEVTNFDSEEREAAIMRLLRRDTEEEIVDMELNNLEGKNTFQRKPIDNVDIEKGCDGDEEDEYDDDGEVYDETSEHLRNLLESVTSKLLQRPTYSESREAETLTETKEETAKDKERVVGMDSQGLAQSKETSDNPHEQAVLMNECPVIEVNNFVFESKSQIESREVEIIDGEYSEEQLSLSHI